MLEQRRLAGSVGSDQSNALRALDHPRALAVADRRDALKKFITGRDASPDAKTKLGPLAKALREYQITGFTWLTRLAANDLGGILADEMCLGKTVQTLAFLRAHQGDGPALVVCPTSLVTNWENEARKLTPELKTLVLEGAAHDRDEGTLEPGDVLWMSAGRGVIHNESVETEARTQAAVALPVAGSSDSPLAPGWNIRACSSHGFSATGTSRV